MREDIAFQSCGATCRGWFYPADTATKGASSPLIVMAHGFSAVKEQLPPEIAAGFVAAGFSVLAFDYRHFGASDGDPRGQLFPLDMVEDYRNAISWASRRQDVDSDRVGVWGTSYSGGLAVYVATVDPRVKAVVVQAPSVISPAARRAMNPEKWAAVGQFLVADRAARYETGVVNTLPVVAPEGTPCVLPGAENYEAYKELQKMAPHWRNEITVESLERIREFDPVSLIHMMAPTALLIIGAEKDSLIPFEALRQSYEQALEPKKFIAMPIRHFEIYQDPWRAKAIEAAIDWYGTYLD